MRGVRKAREREFGRGVSPPSFLAHLSRSSRAQNPLSLPNAYRAGELIDGNLMQNYCVLLA